MTSCPEPWQVARVLRYCRDHKIKVVPRGAGTSLSGGALPLADGIVLGMAKFNRVLEVDFHNRCVVAQPGVTHIMAAQNNAAAHDDLRGRRSTRRVNPGRIFSRIPAQVHPDGAANGEAGCDDLRSSERSEKKAVVLGPHELDDEPFDSRQDAVRAEQPALVEGDDPAVVTHHFARSVRSIPRRTASMR